MQHNWYGLNHQLHLQINTLVFIPIITNHPCKLGFFAFCKIFVDHLQLTLKLKGLNTKEAIHFSINSENISLHVEQMPDEGQPVPHAEETILVLREESRKSLAV